MSNYFQWSGAHECPTVPLLAIFFSGFSLIVYATELLAFLVTSAYLARLQFWN